MLLATADRHQYLNDIIQKIFISYSYKIQNRYLSSSWLSFQWRLGLLYLVTGNLYLLTHFPVDPPPRTVSNLNNTADPSYSHSHLYGRNSWPRLLKMKWFLQDPIVSEHGPRPWGQFIGAAKIPQCMPLSWAGGSFVGSFGGPVIPKSVIWLSDM